MKHIGFLLLTIFPGFVTLLGYFIPNLTYPLKLIVPLSLAGLYFLGVIIYLHFKLYKAQSDNLSLNSDFDKLKVKNDLLRKKIGNYTNFVHKRNLFIKYSLKELEDLIMEYEVFIKYNYRGQKNQQMRNEAGNVKKRVLEIIHKEKRDFDEQLFDVQSNKDN